MFVVMATQDFNLRFRDASPQGILEWLADEEGFTAVMSTSFGIYSAAFLHMVTSHLPQIPVIWIDTGYLPAETYQFAERLTKKLELNVKTYQSYLSPARMEAQYGKLWESDDVNKLDQYDLIRKVIPMQRALKVEGADCLLAGLRREQTENRNTMSRFMEQNGVLKILPILHWVTKDIHRYIKSHDLPFHPLYEKGYVTVGDAHSSRPMTVDDAHERSTRFRGKKQECGLHLEVSEALIESLNSSAL